MALDPGTPLWWLHRLDAELDARLPLFDTLQRYALGDSDNPTATETATKLFRRLMQLAPTNLCGLVSAAPADRLEVQGFRFGDQPDGDRDAWDIWQASDMDTESELAISAALTLGRSFVSVEPNGRRPQLYAEDPRQVVVAYEPGQRRNRVAGFKRWVDDWTGNLFGTLYLPDSMYRVRSDNRPAVATGPTTPAPRKRQWVDRATGAEVAAPERNPLGEVPFFELRNRPQIDGAVMGEFEDVIGVQDRANTIALNTLIAIEFGAFRQKWATGIEIPRDEAGQPVSDVRTALNRLLISENGDARFGDFNATDISPYIKAYESTVQYMAAVTRTPPSYLLGQMANLSAEALAAAEAGLVKKCGQRSRHYESAFEGAMRLAFKSMGDARADATQAETIWADMQIRSEAQATDAAVKKVQAGIIARQQAMEDLGYSETQAKRNDQWMSENDSTAALVNVLTQQAATPAVPAVPSVPAA